MLINKNFPNMATIADMMHVSAKHGAVENGEWIVKFAYHLRISVSKAQRLYKRHGNGMLYAPGGKIVTEDTPRTRGRFSALWGDYAIVYPDGSLVCHTRQQVGRVTRARKKAEIRKEQGLQKREAEQRSAERRTEQIFRDCQQRRHPKRQGRANTHADIGKYVNRHNVCLADREPRTAFTFIKFTENATKGL